MKHLGTIITGIFALLALAVGYGALQHKADKTEQTVEKQEVRLRENEAIDIRQSVILERTVGIIDKLEGKL